MLLPSQSSPDGSPEPSLPTAPPPTPTVTPSVEHATGAESGSVTALLVAWGAGDAAALDALVASVYVELRRQARRAQRREAAGHTLQPTALVHEAYLRLAGQQHGQWGNRAKFYGVAAQLMRRILVDHARARRAAKRGGVDQVRVTLADGDARAPESIAEPEVEMLALHEALDRLAVLDPRQARVVELRYFGGLSIEETAAALSVSPETVRRDWRIAKVWLLRQLGTGEPA